MIFELGTSCKFAPAGEKALSKLGIDLKIDIRETTKDELKEIKKRIKDKKH